MRISFSALPDENLLIGTLVNRAADLYNSYGDCDDSCNHPSGSCGVECPSCCSECCEEIHFHRSSRGDKRRTGYNCQKLACYYTCRYSWKYCSEVMYALDSRDFTGYDRFKILSLGSGPAPDLMAFEQINRTHNKPLIYTGIDKNPYWKTLYDEIKEYSNKVGIEVYYKNKCVFESLDAGLQPCTPYNVLVLQYLISSFPNKKRAQMVDDLCDLLIQKVICKKKIDEPFLVIMNDIDHHTQARNHFSALYEKLKKNGFQDTICKKHFMNRCQDYGDRSVQYSSSVNKFNIPNSVINQFNCAIQCTSSQMILEVR